LGSDLPILDTMFVVGDPALGPFLGVTCPSGTLCLCLMTQSPFLGDTFVACIDPIAFFGSELPIRDTVFVLGDPRVFFGGDLPYSDTVLVLSDLGDLLGG
jgi:hypothetical protein